MLGGTDAGGPPRRCRCLLLQRNGLERPPVVNAGR